MARKPYRRISMGDKLKVYEHLKSRKDEIIEQRLSVKVMTDQIAALLGTSISPYTVWAISKELGINYPRGGDRTRLAKFDEKALMTLVAAVTDLYIRLDETMPEQLRNLKETLTVRMREAMTTNED